MRQSIPRALCLAILVCCTSFPLAARTIKQQEVQVKLHPTTKSLDAVSKISFDVEVRDVEFALHEALEVMEGNRGWEIEELADVDPEDGLRNWRASTTDERGATRLVGVRYEGPLYQDVGGTSFSREKVGGEIRATIGMEGIYLASGSGWYPLIGEDLRIYKIVTVLPEGWTSVTQGELDQQVVSDEGLVTVWKGEQPTDGATLVANRFDVRSREYNGTLVETYFFPEDSTLADGYLDACVGYLRLYEGFLTPYPFKKFAVVENFFPTGYGMPSWTLLGQRVLQLPFIKHTSLGHEVAHNWWGNSVYIGDGGNWCEGLTTYTADYLYKRRESAELGRQYRKNVLRDYTRYTHGGGDFPLMEFVGRHNSATRAVGYGKSMMVFHMLEERIGVSNFRAGLRSVIEEKQWDYATWSDFFRAVEREGGLAELSLEPERLQWVEGTGAARLRLADVTADKEGDGWIVRGELGQEGEPLILHVPLRVETASDPVDETVVISGGATPFEIRVPVKPTALIVDPGYDLFRRLYEEEMESTLSLVLSDEDPLFLLEAGLPADLEQAYRDFANSWVEGEARILPAAERDESERTLVWLGTRPPAFRDPPAELTLTPFFTMFQGERFEPDSNAIVYTGKRGDGRGFMALLANNQAEVRAVASKVPHYGKYSYLAFTKGRNRVKGNWEAAAGPLRHDLD